MPCLHTGAAIDRPEVTHLILPINPEDVWQQPQETNLTNIHNVLNNETHKNTHIPEFEQREKCRSTNVANKGNLISSIRTRYGITPGKPN